MRGPAARPPLALAPRRAPHPTPPPHRSKALDKVGLKRYCCRRMLLTHVDLIDKLLAYNTYKRDPEGAKGGR